MVACTFASCSLAAARLAVVIDASSACTTLHPEVKSFAKSTSVPTRRSPSSSRPRSAMAGLIAGTNHAAWVLCRNPGRPSSTVSQCAPH